MSGCSASTETAVAFEDVAVTLGGVSILESVTAAVPYGGCTAIVGPNGAGKTTLLLALLGEIEHKGHIHVSAGRRGNAAVIGYVPQRLSFDRNMALTVTEFLVMGLQRMPLWFGPLQEHRKCAEELLKSVSAGHLAARRVGALSGGEIQRVLLALALQQGPDILVLDEPVAGVDVQGEHILCELLDNLRSERRFTQIMVSHDLSMVTAHATHVICLNRRVLAEGDPHTILTPDVLMATFGLHMGLPDSKGLPPGGSRQTPPCYHKEDENA